MNATVPLGTELLISAFLTKVDNFDDRFQQKVIENITEETVAASIYHFDMENALNKRLIAMCVQKGIFADVTQQSVVFTLLMYGKELQQFQAQSLQPNEIFRPDPRCLRYNFSSF